MRPSVVVSWSDTGVSVDGPVGPPIVVAAPPQPTAIVASAKERTRIRELENIRAQLTTTTREGYIPAMPRRLLPVIDDEMRRKLDALVASTDARARLDADP